MSNDGQEGLLKGRVESIDALRGFDMFWIIGGERIFGCLDTVFDNRLTEWIKVQLTHAEWVGFHFEDIIMPLFLFIVGVVMPFSFNKRIARGDSKKQLYFHVIKRTAILFVLGMAAQGYLLSYDLSKLRIYCNTLQAIAAGYIISALIMLNIRVKWQVVMTVVLLVLFWALMCLVPVPGHGAGKLTPDGNLAIYLDRMILGHFDDGTPYTWILSSITFAATVLLGVFGGYCLRSKRSSGWKVTVLAAAGVDCILAGYVWGFWFPVIKHLWTSSFVLYSGGMCYLLLAFFYLVMDVWGFKKWAFVFKVIGMNAIAVYMVTRLFDFRLVGNIFVRGLDKWCGNSNSFIHAVAGFSVIWLIFWWMYRKKSFIKF